jgi:hypothetical protein
MASASHRRHLTVGPLKLFDVQGHERHDRSVRQVEEGRGGEQDGYAPITEQLQQTDRVRPAIPIRRHAGGPSLVEFFRSDEEDRGSRQEGHRCYGVKDGREAEPTDQDHRA